MTYRQLDPEQTIATLHTLKNRISERFPESGLAGVAGELCQIAGESKAKIAWIDRPQFGLRLLVFLFVAAFVSLMAVGINEIVRNHQETSGVAEFVSLVEAATNEIILCGAAILFLFSLELRIKRTRALQVLHDLRAMAHVVDMHQLTKDPSRILNAGAEPTRSSPKRQLTPWLLSRYLDYCSELLSLVSKLAALYAQSLPDQVVVAAVNDIETLTNSLSRKIWQKIVILNEGVHSGEIPLPGKPAPVTAPPSPPAAQS
ncbi:MAG: hypothetical protein R3C49_14645 [Planctomycetaceae bacterium]